jgi:probable phosphoglycerate mutase
MRLIIARHGETLDNIRGVYQGHTHGKLSDKGLEQARKLALRLKDEKMDVVFSSDLGRARETTEEILKFHDVPVHYTKDLRERGLGIFEGKPKEEFKNILKEAGSMKYDYRPEGGETFHDIRERVEGFLESIIEKYMGKSVLVVSHKISINILIGSLFKKSPEEAIGMEQYNAAVNIIEVRDDKQHKAHVVNCIKHL